MSDTLPTLMSSAMEYLGAGISVIPIGQNKQPNAKVLPIVDGNPTWKPYQYRHATEEEVTRWCKHASTTGIAAVCGAVSGGLRVIDFDEQEFFKRWGQAIGGRDALKLCLVQRTSRGYQVFIRTSNPGHNTIYAAVPDDSRRGFKAMIETRGEGGYALLPPSVHPSGSIYYWLSGYSDLELLQTPIDPDLLESWERHARSLTKVEIRIPETKTRTERLSVEMEIVRAFNLRHSVTEFLETHGYHPRGKGWVRPEGSDATVYVIEGTHGWPVTFHHNSLDPMFGHPHDAFDWYRIKSHNGERNPALEAAAALCGIEWERPDTELPQNHWVTPNDITVFSHPTRSIVLTDSPSIAEMLHKHEESVALGPHAAWPRGVLAKIKQWSERFVVFGTVEDGHADRTASELDARVARIDLASFIRHKGTIEEFAYQLTKARAPRGDL